ncbi:hypothetical protein MLD52_22120 [Puniceicoccaceae bacterium K14]|nr:hypothetical protein [Puniceicoccaceae bacterium K14]
MNLFLQDLNHLNFHDGTLESIEEDGSHIRMVIDSGAFGPPLEGAKGKQWLIYNCVFECFGVTKNEKKLLKEVNEGSKCLENALPIDEILDQDIRDGCFELSGFHVSKEWAVWRIRAQHFKLTYQSKSEFKIR